MLKDYSTLKNEHAFLKSLGADQIRHAMATMPEGERARLIERAFPGKLTNASTVAQALDEAGAGFRVEKAPLFFPSRCGEKAIESTRQVALVRSDTGAEIGNASPSYGVVQTIESMGAAQVLVDRGAMRLDAVEVVDGGSRIRLTGLVDAHGIEIPGRELDVIANFLVFTADHSGAGSLAASLYSLRLACFNGATAQSLVAGYRLAHTRNAAERVTQANAALLQIREEAAAEATTFQKLALAEFSRESFRTFAQELLDEVRGPVEEDATTRKRNSRKKAIAELEDYFHHGAGNRGATRWDAYNAVTDWLAPRRERLADAQAFAKRFESQAVGHGASVKRRALAKLTR